MRTEGHGRREALHEAEARFRTAFESAPIGMALCDLDGRFLEVNEALCRLLGRPEHQLLTLTWQEVTHPEDLTTQIAKEQKALAGGARSFQMEKRYLRPDGNVAWTLLSRSLVTDPHDKPLYFILQVLDITERKQAEDALRRREEETRRILETAQDAFVGMDAGGKITDWNRQAENIFGWSREEAVGRSLSETIIPERLREDHRKGLKRFLATGMGPVLNKRLELSALRRDGTEFPVEVTIWPLQQGRSHKFNALVHDISERTGAQAALSRQKEELAALHETTLDLIRRLEESSLLEAILVRAATLMRAEHGFLYVVDDRAQQLVARAGIGRFADLIGRRLEKGEAMAGRAWETGEAVAVDDYHTWPGRLPGFEFMRASVVLPLRAGTDIVGVIGLAHAEEGPRFGPEEIDLLSRFGRLASLALDNAHLYSAAQQELRERRRAEKELEQYTEDLRQANEELRIADETKSHFVAVASHELRTPLTSVLGFATVLLNHWERIPDEEKRSQIGLIEGQARRLARLADELLTMSKIEAGALEVRPEAVELNAVLSQVVSTFADRAHEIEVAPAEGLRAMADPDYIHQILTNYVANGLKYGRPPVRMEAHRRGGWVEIVVVDEGSGVPENFVPRLFEKFAQAGGASGGTGLGLSIVRGLARAQGGDAWYEPGWPRGARFGVRLPGA